MVIGLCRPPAALRPLTVMALAFRASRLASAPPLSQNPAYTPDAQYGAYFRVAEAGRILGIWAEVRLSITTSSTITYDGNNILWHSQVLHKLKKRKFKFNLSEYHKLYNFGTMPIQCPSSDEVLTSCKSIFDIGSDHVRWRSLMVGFASLLQNFV